MSLVATRLQNWRVENPQFDRNMARPLEYGALDFFIEQTNAANSIINPNLRDRAFESIGNTVQIPVINYDGDMTVSNVRSCVIADDENTSALYTVNWVTLAVGFTTALEANKTQVFKDALYYTVTSNSVQIPWNARMEFLADMNAMMRANAYPEMLHVIGGAGFDSLVRKMAEHDIYNDVNKRLEYDNKVFHYTNNIVNGSGIFATGYIVADGNVGVLTRVDREALSRTRANFHEWDVVRLPFIDLPVGSHYYTAVGDQSEIAGAASADMVCNVKEYFGFSVDVAFLVAYNSDPTTVANPIIKVELAAPGSANPFAMPVEVVNDTANPVKTQEVQ